MPKGPMELTHDEKIRALAAMRKYGGGFASNLGEAWLRADQDNDRKLRLAFGDLLMEYVEMADHIERKRLGHQTEEE